MVGAAPALSTSEQTVRIYARGWTVPITSQELAARFPRNIVPGLEAVRDIEVRPTSAHATLVVQAGHEPLNVVSKVHGLYSKSTWKGGILTIEKGRPGYLERLQAEKVETGRTPLARLRQRLAREGNRVVDAVHGRPIPPPSDAKQVVSVKELNIRRRTGSKHWTAHLDDVSLNLNKRRRFNSSDESDEEDAASEAPEVGAATAESSAVEEEEPAVPALSANELMKNLLKGASQHHQTPSSYCCVEDDGPCEKPAAAALEEPRAVAEPTESDDAVSEEEDPLPEPATATESPTTTTESPATVVTENPAAAEETSLCGLALFARQALQNAPEPLRLFGGAPASKGPPTDRPSSLLARFRRTVTDDD